jgi:hypothetical protein
MSEQSPSITAIKPEKLAEILRKSGSREVSAEAIAADFKAGAPICGDGTVNLIEYAAWLVSNHGGSDGN